MRQGLAARRTAAAVYWRPYIYCRRRPFEGGAVTWTPRKGLARNHGFCALYWQPVVFTMRTVTPYELEREAEYIFNKPSFLAVSQRLHCETPLRANLASSTLAVLFADVSEPRFLDSCHASETAYREVAEEIAQHVIPLVSSRGRRASLGELRRATFRTRLQSSLSDELQR